jgi:hypothetical protein
MVDVLQKADVMTCCLTDPARDVRLAGRFEAIVIGHDFWGQETLLEHFPPCLADPTIKAHGSGNDSVHVVPWQLRRTMVSEPIIPRSLFNTAVLGSATDSPVTP